MDVHLTRILYYFVLKGPTKHFMKKTTEVYSSFTITSVKVFISEIQLGAPGLSKSRGQLTSSDLVKTAMQ